MGGRARDREPARRRARGSRGLRGPRCTASPRTASRTSRPTSWPTAIRQLAEFEASDAKRLDILFHSAGGESVAITAERSEDGWTSRPESFAPGKVEALLGALANLRARDIAAESMGPEELADVALAPANAIFSVFGEAPAGGEEGEAPRLAEVHLGILRGTDGIFAQRAGDDTVFVLDFELAEHLPVSYEAFENRFRSRSGRDRQLPRVARTRPRDAGRLEAARRQQLRQGSSSRARPRQARRISSIWSCTRPLLATHSMPERRAGPPERSLTRPPASSTISRPAATSQGCSFSSQ